MNIGVQINDFSDLIPFIGNKFIKLDSIPIELDLNYLSKREFDDLLDILNEIETGEIKVKDINKKNEIREVAIISGNETVSTSEFLRLYYKTDINRNHTIAFNKWLVDEGYQESNNGGYRLLDEEMGYSVGNQIKWKYNSLKLAVSSVNLILSQLMKTFGGENV
jgi:hypothetical protein